MKIIMSLMGLLFVFGVSQKSLACDCDKNAKKDKASSTAVADNHDSKKGDSQEGGTCEGCKDCKDGKACKCGDKKGESCGADEKSCKDGKSCGCGKKHKA